MDRVLPPDFVALAELSHHLEEVALSLAGDGAGARLVAHELEAQAGGQREAVAITLSYLLRHRNLGTWADGAGLDVAIDGAVTALRRVGAAA